MTISFFSLKCFKKYYKEEQMFEYNNLDMILKDADVINRRTTSISQ